MKAYILSNSNILVQDKSFLRYNLTIIIVIWKRKEIYNVLISEMCVLKYTNKRKIRLNIEEWFQSHFCRQNISVAIAAIFWVTYLLA
jgi:hypothetical protein